MLYNLSRNFSLLLLVQESVATISALIDALVISASYIRAMQTLACQVKVHHRKVVSRSIAKEEMFERRHACIQSSFSLGTTRNLEWTNLIHCLSEEKQNCPQLE